jgi:hypothetical protein
MSGTPKPAGHIPGRPILGGLHDQYVRISFATGTGTSRVCSCYSFNIEGDRRITAWSSKLPITDLMSC